MPNYSVFLQVFFAVLLATGISFGAAVWYIHTEVAGFEDTMRASVITITDAIDNFNIFGKK